jgi:hypothetical protein
VHNTIDQATDGRWALALKQTTGTNYVRDNILLNRHSFRGGLEFSTPEDAANENSDYNVVSIISTNDGDTTLTLSQWQALAHDTHSVTGALTAVFVDANAGNYLLKTNSPALNKGVTWGGIASDFDGMPRPLGPAPDIGCYESSPLSVKMIPLDEDSFRLQLLGGAGRTFKIESATNLGSWVSIATFTRSNRIPEITVSNGISQQFYRGSFTP